ncbi:MAG: GGDEF domain-containing protein [Oscillospiraceae bacterium]
MTSEEVCTLIKELEYAFDIVRLVDVTLTRQYTPDENNRLVCGKYDCYAVWNKSHRCENCISAKAISRKTRITKFEFIGSEVYYVISKYTEVDGNPYALEMVTKITDETLFGAYGQNSFVKSIESFNARLYTDSLTGAGNRAYYDEQLSGLGGFSAVAIMDVDLFKEINDSYGHTAGDMALQCAVQAVTSCIRSSDHILRYGGDEFVLIFRDLPPEKLQSKLDDICRRVAETVIPEYPEIRLSASIGGCRSDIFPDTASAVKAADRLLYKAKERRGCAVTDISQDLGKAALGT